jgi:protein-disulfide isomerase
MFLVMMAAGVVLLVKRKNATRLALATAVAPWSDLDSPVPISSDDAMLGERNALITIVTFADLQDPFTARNAKDLDELRRLYGSDLRIVWKHEPLPFHINARPAAEASRIVFLKAGNDAFWRFHDKALANQFALDTFNLERFAQDEGLNLSTFRSEMSLHIAGPKVDSDHALAKSLAVTGTPTAFINGIRVTGALSLSGFQRTIDTELLHARGKVTAGTPRDRVYVETSRINFAKPSVLPTSTISDPLSGSTPPEPALFRVPVGLSPVRGKATALVTIVEFGGFQDPFCKLAESTLKTVEAEYGDKVRIVWKNQPLSFHARSEPAAELALEARAEKGDKAFFTARDKLFVSAPRLENADLLSIAKSMGLDQGKVSTAILTRKHKQSIDDDVSLASSLKSTGTPTFFINGKKLSGAQSITTFRTIIDREIVRAKVELAKGTSPTALYDALTSPEAALAATR